MVEVMVVEPDEGKCMQCMATKRKLNEMSISFTTTKASEKLDLIRELDAIQAPLVVILEKGNIINHWTGFRPNNLKQLKENNYVFKN